MPKIDGMFVGNFGSYSGSDDDEGYAQDDEAIAMAVDMMFSMCGNAGQESIIGNGCAAFESWGIAALEGLGSNDGNYPEYISTIIGAVGYSAWYGSQEIWDEGYEALSEQSHFHDGQPDVGDKGVEF